MPVFLNPPPQRIRITREDFVIPEQPLVRMDPTAEEAGDIRSMLQSLLPGAQISGKLDVEAPVRLSLVEPASLLDEALPAGAAGQAYTLVVSPEGIDLRAARVNGWRYGLLTLAQLAGERAIVGASVQDWPEFATRGVRVPWSAAAFRPEFRDRFLRNLSHWRWNAVAFSEDDPSWQPSEPLVRLIPANAAPPASAQLVESAGLYPQFERRLPRLLEEARQAAASGKAEWWLDLGLLPEETLLDTLWYGLGFAGSCAWNPAKADLKAHRRSFSRFFFGTETPALSRALQSLEAAEEALSGPETGLSRVLDRDAPFAPERVATTLRLDERAGEAAQRAEAAIEGFDEAAVLVEANAEVVQTLRAAAGGLAELGQRLAGLSRARARYTSAYEAESNARAASRRTQAAAEELETLAAALRTRREEFARAWKRERAIPIPASAGTDLDERASAMGRRGADVRELRNHYIQTGNLKPPAEAGMSLPLPRADRGVVPHRRSLRSLPMWWPEGGTARMRIELESDGHGLPWEVLLDLRAHGGEAGAFNIRAAQLVALDADEAVTGAIPVQLTRRGFVFTPLPGVRAYHLYLSPEGAEERFERQVRARQSREEVRVDSARLLARFAATGELVSMAVPEFPEEALRPREPEQPLLHFGEHHFGEGTRVRVLETGPLLARIQVESPSGFSARYDFYGALPACEISLNVPVTTVRMPWCAEVWENAAGYPASPGSTPAPSTWGATTRPDGLTAALLTPAHETSQTIEGSARVVTSPTGLRYLTVLLGHLSDPADELASLTAALAAPPRILVGPVEERRVVEF